MQKRKLSFDDRILRALQRHRNRFGKMPDEAWTKRANRLIRISKQAEIDMPMTFCLFIATGLALIIHQL